MKAKQITIFTMLLIGGYTIFKLSQSACQPCETSQMKIIEACSPVPSAYTIIYRRLNCFCDNSQDWTKLGAIIRRLNYYKDIYGSKYPTNIFGTKNIPCSDDELQYDVFEDDEVFLYIQQDTSKTIYDGGLQSLYINNVVSSKRSIDILDIGKENRTVNHNTKRATVQYKMNYDELNGTALVSFQQAIYYDSSYQKRFKNVEYQLINKETRRHDASIRYEDFGERFYLDVF
ncbi:hypothetical protein [Larkinella punicea]|uniref:Uncharacterized protein n=1 Tax=Larkinella punicea TaxID=2315727 RepID=A0A368JTG5_9BACT|nr:hypothetical protein [Larkinella punicea]RCR70246.1 hypothetical protein DUE52_07735 [Larkinella punicea]